ncbi:MAG: hypothetical protein HY074_05310 [Deltaproteobacteria bacterium]|nr:hypothetical protein [Deltaproteobacteria bacterium]
MLRKIDIGMDKNIFIVDPKQAKKPQLKFLADDIPKTPDESISEARKISIPNWINSEPLLTGHIDDDGQAYLFFIADTLKKKVINLEIWDHTLLPCRRSLSYSLEWHRRYGHSGLLTIGIHSPLFEFGKDKRLIMDTVRELGIPFPVVLDNEFEIWRSLENRFWPRRLLLDGTGKTHLDVVGEGHYAEIEHTIQLMLRDLSPGLPCPPILKPLRQIDDPDYVIPSTSSEIFLGLKKNMRLGNSNAFKAPAEEIIFKDDAEGNYPLDAPYLDGGWLATSESIYGTPHKGDIKLTMKFAATDVYLVARSRSKNPIDVPQGTKVQVLVDRKSVTDDKAGSDIAINELRRSVLVARDPRLYHLATRLDPHGTHELTLTIEEDSLHTIEIYGLFFEHSA